MTMTTARSSRNALALARRVAAFVALAVALIVGTGTPAGADDGYGPIISPIWVIFGTDQVPNQHGWFNEPVETFFLCADPDTVLTCPDDVTMTEGRQVPISSIDATGRATTGVFGPINVDQTPPTINIVNNGATFRQSDRVLLGCDVSDNRSGLQWVSNPCPAWGAPASGYAPGTYSYLVQASDYADNANSVVGVFHIVK